MSCGTERILVDSRNEYAAHLDAVVALFGETFGREFPVAGWNQYYFQNPYGDPIASLTYAGSALIAHQALIPGVACNREMATRYYLSMSTMVHPAHRSMPVFVEMFQSVLQHASALGGGFAVGFPNAGAYLSQRRCFGFQTMFESPLRNWLPPDAASALVSPDPKLGQSHAGRFSPPCTAEYWSWRTKLNMARAVVVNGRLRVVYKLLAGGTLNVLNVELPDHGATSLDLAGLAAAEGCRNVRITDYHASVLGIAGSELTSHEDYCLRMNVLPLCQPVPELQFNLLFCDIF